MCTVQEIIDIHIDDTTEYLPLCDTLCSLYTLVLLWSSFACGLCCRSLQVFRPYAKHLLGPLLQLVVSENNGGEGIHFMVVDIVVTVLSWTSVVSPKVPKAYDFISASCISFFMTYTYISITI